MLLPSLVGTTVESDLPSRLSVHVQVLIYQPPRTEEMPYGQPVFVV